MSFPTESYGFALLATLSMASCYRAEIDISVLGSDPASAGFAGTALGGGSGANDSAGSGGTPASAGADESAGSAGRQCVDTVDNTQLGCRVHVPSQAQCSVQDPNGFDGCSLGGCIVCDDVTTLTRTTSNGTRVVSRTPLARLVYA